MKSGWWERLAAALLWVGCLAIVLWGVSEVYLSHQGYTVDDGASYKKFGSYDAYLGWKEAPGSSTPFNSVEDERWYVAHIWPDTSRRSRPQRAKKCSKRVLLVGCSHTYGLGINDEETFAWQLNERFPEVAFDNFGVNGYSTYQCYLREKQQLLMNPDSYDLVLYSAFDDHLHRNANWNVKSGELHSTGWYLFNPRVGYSDQGELLFYSGERRWPWDNLSVLVNFAKRVYYAYIIRQDQAEHERFSATKYCLFWELNRRMADQAQRHGAQYGLVWLFDKSAWKETLAQRHFLHDNYPWPQNPVLWGAEPEYPCLCIDLEQDTLQNHHVPEDLGHYDRYIHSVWAKHIGDWVEGLLKDK